MNESAHKEYLARLERQKFIEKMERMMIPRMYWGAKLDVIPDELKHKKILVCVIQKLGQIIKDGKGVMISGKHKSGKSSIASILAKASKKLNMTVTVVWVSATDYANGEFREQVFEEETKIWQRCREVDLLVVDGMGDEIKDDVGSRDIEEIIRKRYENKKSTIITTSIPSEDFSRIYRIASDVMQEIAFPIIVEGIDYGEINKRAMGEEIDNLLSDVPA